MSVERFELVGHDNPLGRYPAAVVPIGQLNGSLVAVYAADESAELSPLKPRVKFVRHDKTLKATLKEFDYRLHRLFAFSETDVEIYSIRGEALYLSELLRRPATRRESPFFRLSLAKGAGQPLQVVRELVSCIEELREGPEGFVGVWYAAQRDDLFASAGGLYRALLPGNWRELLARFAREVRPAARTAARRASLSRRMLATYIPLAEGRQTQPQIRRVTKAEVKDVRLPASVVKRFNEKFGLSRAQVKSFFEELARLASRELRANGAFIIPGLGTLVLSQRRAREGRNPVTGESVKIQAGQSLKFVVSKRIKDSVSVKGRPLSRYK
jgi:DNA-binding protein HU-beta